jgi:hypothetical protein
MCSLWYERVKVCYKVGWLAVERDCGGSSEGGSNEFEGKL